HRQPPARLEPDQEHLAGLVGGEGEARAHARQPVREMPRRGECELLFRRGGGWLRAGAGRHRSILPGCRYRVMTLSSNSYPNFEWLSRSNFSFLVIFPR